MASPWIFGTRKLFSTCWTSVYRTSAAIDRLGACGRPEQDRRDGRDDRADDRQRARGRRRSPRAGSRSDRRSGPRCRLRTIRPTNVRMPTAKPRMTWPGPTVRRPARRRRSAQVSNFQAAGSARSKAATSRPVLGEVEDPDRQDHVAEQRAKQAPGAGDERQEECQVEPGPRPALRDPARMLSIQSRNPDGIWRCE